MAFWRKNYSCPVCEKKFQKVEQLMQHQQLAHENKLYECRQCKASFEGMEQMRDHAKKFHSYTKKKKSASD
jgi:DNA-directed RNA polymerase subunit RPC12/RpoP